MSKHFEDNFTAPTMLSRLPVVRAAITSIRVVRRAAVRSTLCLVLSLFAGLSAFAQDTVIHHNNITVGLGAATRAGNSTDYLATAPLVTIGYGYRFNRLFQGDAGIQIAFGAANNQNAELTDFGTLHGGDHEFMVPLGGRVCIPQPLKRIEVSAGGGYSETVSSNGGFYSPAHCVVGGGGYGLANVSYFLDTNHNVRTGTTSITTPRPRTG